MDVVSPPRQREDKTRETSSLWGEREEFRGNEELRLRGGWERRIGSVARESCGGEKCRMVIWLEAWIYVEGFALVLPNVLGFVKSNEELMKHIRNY